MANNLMKHQLNALWAWCVEETGKCDIIVKYSALDQRVFAPTQKDGYVRLNIGPAAVRDLSITSRRVTFDCWMNNAPHIVDIKLEDVVGVMHEGSGFAIIPGLVAIQDEGRISLFSTSEAPESVEEAPTVVEGNVVHATFGKKR